VNLQEPLAKVDVEGSNPFSRSIKRVEFDAITALFTAFVPGPSHRAGRRTPPLRSRLSLTAGQLSSAVFRGTFTGASWRDFARAAAVAIEITLPTAARISSCCAVE
jgi:hypothetical protein